MTLEKDLEPLMQLVALKLKSGDIFSEFQLIQWLQLPEQGIFHADALKHTRTLFESHFLLMHVLYRLQQQWFEQQHAYLTISPLHIQKSLWQTGTTEQQVSSHDPLAAYYLDLNELATEEEEINQLLNSFWQKMLYNEHQQQDFATLKLSIGADKASIKKQYRKLAMQHHPDRGGNAEQFHAIQVAFQRLMHR